MKRRISLPDSLFTAAWLLFHAAIIAAFLLAAVCGGGIRTDADLFAMIPDTGSNAAMAKADRQLTQNSARHVFILVSHADFKNAKLMAERVYGDLSLHTEQFAQLSLAADGAAASEIEEFVYANRYRLLPKEASEEILVSEEGTRVFAERAAAMAYGGISFSTFSSLNRLDADPFLLSDAAMAAYMAAVQAAGTALSPIDGVLATEFEGKWYVLIRGTLSKAGAKLASKDNAVHTIYSICLPLEQEGFRFVFSGTPFHSYESSLSASREISLISTVSLLLVLSILIFIFRSPLPIALSIFSIILSLAVAFSATHLLFGNIQMLTLVFGTSLIGCCIDYSLHFFMHWKADSSLRTGAELRSALFKGLLFSFLSTQICYLLLFCMPFPLLRQISLFSFTGITSSFLTTLGFYPLLPVPQKRNVPHLSFAPPRVGQWAKVFLGACITLAVGIPALRHKSFAVRNDIARLYTMQGRLKEDAVLSYQVLRYSPSSWLIVSGGTEEEVLQKEESLCEKLPDKYISASRFIPSRAMQEKSLAAVERLLPLAPQQLALLGLEASDAEQLCSSFEQEKEKGRLLVPLKTDAGSAVPESLESIIEMLWLGKIGDKFYSVVLPTTVTDESFYESLARDNDGVYFENKIKSINSSLDWLTTRVLLIFALAYIAIIALLKAIYSWKQTLRIASVPLISIIAITAAFTVAGYPLDFFCTAGMMLVFGLGLDYIIYMTEDAGRKERHASAIEASAVFLSFITTELSFGALAFSSFVPVRIIGLCISTGCLAAFIGTAVWTADWQEN